MLPCPGTNIMQRAQERHSGIVKGQKAKTKQNGTDLVHMRTRLGRPEGLPQTDGILQQEVKNQSSMWILLSIGANQLPVKVFLACGSLRPKH